MINVTTQSLRTHARVWDVFVVQILVGVLAWLGLGFVLLKEWVYAGLAFDVIGAAYSHIAVGDGLKDDATATVGSS